MATLYQREMKLMDDFNGRKIAFDVATSSVIFLDDIAFRILSLRSLIDTCSLPKEIGNGLKKNEIQEAIDEMIKSKILLTKPQRRKIAPLDKQEEILIGGVSFNVSHKCNMRCSYCFGGGGSYNGPAVNMDTKTIKAGIDYLFSHCGNLDNIIISFFGGEPFLNWRVMKWAIDYAQTLAQKRSIKITFFITTNGTLLTQDRLKFLNNFNIRLTISIDGPQEIHDQERKFINGNGSYNLVRRNIRLALQYPNITVQARPTLTPSSCRKIIEVYQHIRELGIERMHARPESKYGNRKGLSIIDYEHLGQRLEELARELILSTKRGEYWGLINVIKFLNMLYFRIVRHDYCGAGISVISISPDGSIFPCPRFTGEKKFLIGSILNGGVDQKKRSIFLDNTVDNREGCQKCWARYICGGGCAYMHWTATGDIKKNDEIWCSWTKQSIEIAVKTYAHLQENDEDKIQEFFVRYMPLISDFGEGANELVTSILQRKEG